MHDIKVAHNMRPIIFATTRTHRPSLSISSGISIVTSGKYVVIMAAVSLARVISDTRTDVMGKSPSNHVANRCPVKAACLRPNSVKMRLPSSCEIFDKYQ